MNSQYRRGNNAAPMQVGMLKRSRPEQVLRRFSTATFASSIVSKMCR